MLTLIPTACGIAIVFLTIMLFRNNHTHAMRMDALERLDKAAIRDIDEGRQYRWRWEAWETLKYDDVLWSLTKWHVDDFYDSEGVPIGYPRPKPEPRYVKLEIGNRNA